MPRMVILSSEFPPGPGGIGTHACQLARDFANHGWAVQVISPQDYAIESEITAFNQAQNFKITRLPSHRFKLLQDLKRFWTALKAVREFKPDLVMASGARAIWLAAILQRWHQTPWVLVGHGTEFGSRKILGARLTRWAGNRASQVICVSRYTQQALMDLGISRPPSLVIHNGADHQRFYPLPESQAAAFRQAQGVSESCILLTVGNVSDRKGQEVVIRALPIVKKDIPAIQYWMAGLPSEQKKLTDLAAHLGVGDNIRFWGRVTDATLLNLYNACDLFLMTSRQLADGDFEGYGIAVIEAALCGKTAVVSDNSGLAEAVADGVTGLTVPQDDPQAVADAILFLFHNNQTCEQLSDNAYQNAVQNQTWNKVLGHYRIALKKILDNQEP